MEGSGVKRVLVYYKSFSTILGGSDYLPLALISELQKKCKVTLALDWPSNLMRASSLCEITINLPELKVVTIKPKNRLIRIIDLYLPFYRTKQLKRLAKTVDICISANNIADFGTPAFHFITNVPNYTQKRASETRHTQAFLIRILRQLLVLIADGVVRPILGLRSPRQILKDRREHIYPNSEYTARELRHYYGVARFTYDLFFPPVLFEPATLPKQRNPLLVVYIGRICPAKRLTEIISIVEHARAISGRNIELAVAGQIDDSPYAKAVKSLTTNRNWCRLVGPVYGKDKEMFLSQASYAIHAERDEAFGISVAEYLKAGLIPIVPNEGGTTEVIDSPALTYHTNENAAHILANLLADEDFRAREHAHCAKRAQFFSREAYLKRQQNLLEKILQPMMTSSKNPESFHD